MLRPYYFVYKTVCLINNKIYVGKHSTYNLVDGYLGGGVFLARAIKKYGKEHFEKSVLEYTDYDHLNEREIYWIEKLNARDPEIGYNLAKGGDGGDVLTGHPNRLLISQKKFETRKKNGTLKLTETTKQHMRKPHRKFSEATKLKMKGRIPHNRGKKMNKPAWNKGLTKEQDTRIKSKPAWNKGQTSWNKGLTAKNNEIVKRISETLKGKPSGNKGLPAWNKGLTMKPNSQETIERKRQAFHRQPIRVCPHCGLKSKSKSLMIRYHFDNCKFNINKNIITFVKVSC